MDKNRRKLLQAGLVGGTALVAGCVQPDNSVAECTPETRAKPAAMKILVLGGTGYIGPHMVREMLRRGHEVTLFNRGKRNADIFPDVETLVGDRDSQLDALRNRQWDAVVDNSGYVPRMVRESAELLRSAVPHYLFISSISAYANFNIELDENSPLGTMPDETVEEVTNETYGPMKVLCEKAVTDIYGEADTTILRPTYICGPGDHTDRFSYWAVRSARGGEMLWPGSPADALQIIDVRDLALFVVDCLEQKINGIYNTVTPRGGYTMGRMLEDSQAVAPSNVTPIWMDLDFINEHKLLETNSLPTWAPTDSEEGKWAYVSGERAVAAGMVNRPIRETIRDLLDWWKTLPEERTAKMRAGMTVEREAELIAAWKARS